MTEYTEYYRNSAEYKKYIEDTIETYNTNGQKTVLFVCDNAYPFVDGVWRVLSSYVQVIRERYPQYNVILMCPDYKGKVYIKDAPILGVRSRFSAKLHYQMGLPNFDGQLKRWLRKLKIDIIHCHAPFLCGLMARKLHLKRKIPMVTTFHSLYAKDFMKVTKSRLITKMGMSIIMKVFKSSDEVWTMHEASEKVLRSYGFKGKCRLISNGTGMKPLPNLQQVRDQFRAQHQLGDTKTLLYVGRLYSEKGVLFIADVLQKLKQQNVNFKMFYVGNGPDKKRLKNKIRNYNLTQDVVFTGELQSPDELIPYYAGADLLLLPSQYDTFGLVKIEAATYETPGVFITGTCAAYGVTDKVNGFLLPYNAEQFAQGLVEILNSNSLQQVGKQALNDLHVEWEEIVAQCVDAYEQVIAS